MARQARTSSCLAVAMAAAGLLALLAVPAPAEASSRSLQQSLTCLQAVPKCFPGQCSTLQPLGRLVCNRCKANFRPVVRVLQGAQYIVQCVCPPGQHHNTTTDRCDPCTRGYFCLGGEFIDSRNAALGARTKCSSDNIITTLGTGAQSKSACIAPAGYSIRNPSALGTNTYQASKCNASTYAPANNRLAACVRCQSGLLEDPADNLGEPGFPARSSISIVCKVPPGKWYSQNVVKTCARGLYRGGYVGYKNQTAASCTACPPGITTSVAGSSSRANCSRLLAGYGITTSATVYIPGDPLTIPTNAQDATNVTVTGADQCSVGFWSALDYNVCVPCPYNTTTKSAASTTINDCQIPPGYVVSGGTMQQCGNGFWRAGWLPWNSNATCTSCGVNISSTGVDFDEDPRVSDGLVRASPASCYIPAGWEVTYNRATATWSARACPPNTYGVSDVLYGLYSGLVQVPCKSCPRGMVTDPPGQSANNDSDACTNPAGYGYSSEGATPCAPGFWAAYNGRLPCQQCAPGRMTVDNSSAQTSVLACLVQTGYGVSPGDAAAAGSNTTAQAVLPAAECALGTFQPTNTTLNATCSPCANGTTTSVGNTGTCSDCAAGYGRATVGDSCTACDIGKYARPGEGVCSSCVSTTFSDVYGSAIYTSNGTTTFLGATGSEFCVPIVSHLAQDAGQLISLPANLTNATTQASAAACTALCGGDKCCIAAWTSNTSTCVLSSLVAVALNSTPASGDLHLRWKLPPSERVAVSSKIGAKVMSSGIYSSCQVPGSTGATAADIGTGLVITSGTLVDRDVVLGPTYSSSATGYSGTHSTCRDACDGSALCWGYLWDGTACFFRGGEDALGIDTYFVMPNNATLVSLDW